LRSIWRPFADTTIETFLIPPHAASAFWHLRVHCITFEPNSTRDLTIAEGGWATYGQGREGRTIGTSSYWSAGSSGFDPKVPEGVLESEEQGSVLCASAGGVVGILDLSAYPTKRNPRAVKLDPNCNIVFSRSICPTLIERLAANEVRQKWIVTAVFGLPFPQGKSVSWEEEWASRPEMPKEIQALVESSMKAQQERV